MLQGDMLRQAAARWPDVAAIVCGPERWTYKTLDDATERLAVGLSQAGVKTGDRVAIFIPNGIELACSYFACFKLGAVAVPLNNRYAHPEVRYAIEQSGATTLLVHEDLWNEVAPLPLAELGVTRCFCAGRRAMLGSKPLKSLRVPIHMDGNRPCSAKTSPPPSSTRPARPPSPRASPTRTARSRPATASSPQRRR